MISQTTFVDLNLACRGVVYSYLGCPMPKKREDSIATRLDRITYIIIEATALQVEANQDLRSCVGSVVDKQISNKEKMYYHVNQVFFTHFPSCAPPISSSFIVQFAHVSVFCDQLARGIELQDRLFTDVKAFLALPQENLVLPSEIQALAEFRVQAWLELGVRPEERVFEELCLQGNEDTIAYYLRAFFQTGVQASHFMDKGNAIFRALLRNPAVKQWRGIFDILHQRGAEISPAGKLVAILKDENQAANCLFLKGLDISNLKKPLSVVCLEKVISSLSSNWAQATIWELVDLFQEVNMGEKELNLLMEADLDFATQLIECLLPPSDETAAASSSASAEVILVEDL